MRRGTTSRAIACLVLLTFSVSAVLQPRAWAQETRFTFEEFVEAYEDQRQEGYLSSPVQTTVSADSAAGQTQLHVASVQGFQAGQRIVIDEGGSAEEGHTIAAIDGGALKLSANLAKAHTAADRHAVTGLPVPPPLSDAEKQDLVYAFFVKKYEVAFDLLDGSLVALDNAYKNQLQPIYDAETRKVVEDAIAGVRDVIAYGKADLAAKKANVATTEGRSALAASAEINGTAAQAALAHLSNAIGGLIVNERIRQWQNAKRDPSYTRPVRVARTKLAQGAFKVEIQGYTRSDDNVQVKGHLQDLFENYKTWTTLQPATASLTRAGQELAGFIKVTEDFTQVVEGIEQAQLAIALASAILTAVELAEAVTAISPALGRLFANAPRLQLAEVALAGTGQTFTTVIVVGGGQATASIAEILALLGVGAVRVGSAATVAVTMMKAGTGGFPTRNIQPRGQSAKAPKNSKNVDYPDIKYPKGHPKAGQRMEFPGFDEMKEIPKAKRAAWSGSGKTGPIKGRDAYIQEWKNRGLADPPGGWEKYDIHHIKPRKYGGQNAWDNLIPILREQHNGPGGVTSWWASFVL